MNDVLAETNEKKEEITISSKFHIPLIFAFDHNFRLVDAQLRTWAGSTEKKKHKKWSTKKQTIRTCYYWCITTDNNKWAGKP